MQTIPLQEPQEFACGDHVICLDGHGRLAFANSEGETVGSDLSSCTHVVLWSGRGWCCVLGLQGRDVILVRPTEGQLVAAGQLDRLDLRDGYDPGGMHRVEIREITDGDILVVFELGLARVSEARIVWQRRHEDITARVVDIADGVVWLEGEHERFGYDLQHGDPRFRTEF